MSRRITIRLDNEIHERIQQRSQETSLDFSFLVREALRKYLADSGTTAQEPKPDYTNLVMPDQAFALTGPYRAFSGDLRLEMRKRFLDFLALAHSTAKIWPRSPGIREVYAGLLALGHHLGIGNDVRHA